MPLIAAIDSLSRARIDMFTDCERARSPSYVPMAEMRRPSRAAALQGSAISGASASPFDCGLPSPSPPRSGPPSPLQKARPSPVKTTTRTRSSSCACVIVSTMSRFMPTVIGLRRSGSLSVITATPESCRATSNPRNAPSFILVSSRTRSGAGRAVTRLSYHRFARPALVTMGRRDGRGMLLRRMDDLL